MLFTDFCSLKPGSRVKLLGEFMPFVVTEKMDDSSCIAVPALVDASMRPQVINSDNYFLFQLDGV